MKKYILALLFFANQFTVYSQCSFEELFPLRWGRSGFMINEYYQGRQAYLVDTAGIPASIFEHHQDYFKTARHLNLKFFVYNAPYQPCFRTYNVKISAIASDSGLLAYRFIAEYPFDKQKDYFLVVDSLRKLMSSKYIYTKNFENLTNQGDSLKGEGNSFYYNNQPVNKENLTYPPAVIRAGYVGRQPVQNATKPGIAVNSATIIDKYVIEVLYKQEAFR